MNINNNVSKPITAAVLFAPYCWGWRSGWPVVMLSRAPPSSHLGLTWWSKGRRLSWVLRLSSLARVIIAVNEKDRAAPLGPRFGPKGGFCFGTLVFFLSLSLFHAFSLGGAYTCKWAKIKHPTAPLTDRSASVYASFRPCSQARISAANTDTAPPKPSICWS
jgi:hypothetical protein